MGTPCTTNVTTFANVPAVGSIVTATMINELQQYIRDEQARRGLAQTAFTANAATQVLDATDLSVLRDAINALAAKTWTNSYTAGSLAKASHVTELQNQLNVAEVACLCDCNYCTCDCNYCTCDCNYCTCDCNYCTCNCNYCTCNCNYACVCNCNYSVWSDIRLKTEIKYF